MADLYAKLKLPKQRVYVKNAGFIKRLLAFAADILLLDIVVFSSFQALLTGVTVDFSTQLSPHLYAIAVVLSLITMTYFILFEYLLGQTPGKMLLGIKVENATLWRAFVRNLHFIPVFPFPLLWILEPAYLLWRKSRLLEVLTKTRTVERIII